MRRKPFLYHIELRVSNFPKSLQFYNALFRYLGWEQIHQGDDFCGWGDRTGKGDVWIEQTKEEYLKHNFHREHTGLNHIAFQVESKEEVDRFYKEFLLKNKITLVDGAPKEYPGVKNTFYATVFEDPDGIKLEVIYVLGR